MKKSELVAQLAARTGLTKRAAAQCLDATFDCIADALACGEHIAIGGFGTFDVKQRPGRTGHIPTTGESIDIPAATVPIFKPAKQLKEKVNSCD